MGNDLIEKFSNVETARRWAVGIMVCMVVVVVCLTLLAHLKRDGSDDTFEKGVMELGFSVVLPSFAFIVANGAISRRKTKTPREPNYLAPVFLLGLGALCLTTVLLLGWYSLFATSHRVVHLGGGQTQRQPVPYYFGEAASVIGMIISPTIAAMLAVQVFSGAPAK